MRSEQPECEHGAPGGTPATCALCRAAAEAKRAAWNASRSIDLFDVRKAAAGDDE